MKNFMYMKNGIAIVTCLLLFVAAARAEDVGTNQMLFQIEESGEIVVIEGKWHSVTGTPTVQVPHTNSVRIECFRNLRTCVEHIAKLIRPSDDLLGFVKKPSLFVEKEVFRVLEWSKSAIIAIAEPRAADLGIRISLVDQSAERTSRDTSARSAKGAKPSVIHLWKLE